MEALENVRFISCGTVVINFAQDVGFSMSETEVTVPSLYSHMVVDIEV